MKFASAVVFAGGYIRNVAAFFSVVVVSAACWAQACSQDPGLANAQPPLNGTVCQALDEIFKDFSGSCSLTFPITLVKKSDISKAANRAKTTTVSAVPPLFVASVNRMNMTNPVRIPQDLGLARLLSQVFSTASLSALRVNDYIGATAMQQASTLSQLGIDATGYSTSCQATLAANVNANVDFTFAPVTIQSSLSGSLNAGAKSGLLISVGTFDSPLWVFTSSGVDALYSDLLMLAWRINNGNNGSLYYLAHARGFSSSQVTSNQMYADAAVSAALAAGIFSISTKDNLKFAQSVTDELSASLYDTVADSPAAADFQVIPLVADLQADIAKLQLAPPAVSTKILLHVNDKANITQQVAGVPGDMCAGQGTTWVVGDANTAQADWSGGPITTSVTKDTQNVPGCAFSFDLQNISGGTAGFTATPVITGNYQGTTFSLKLQPISFTASQYPSFGSKVPYNQTGSPRTVNSVSVLQCSVVITVDQAPAGNGYNSVSWSANPITASCANNTAINLSPPNNNPMSIAPTGNGQVTAGLDYDIGDAKGTLDGADPTPIQCTLNAGTLEFVDTSGTLPVVSRAISSAQGLGIKLPHIKPTLSLALLSPTGTTYTFGGTIQGVSDESVLNGSTASLTEGTTVLGVGRIKPNFTVIFDPIPLNPAVAHTITFALSSSGTISGVTSQPLQVPARQ